MTDTSSGEGFDASQDPSTGDSKIASISEAGFLEAPFSVVAEIEAEETRDEMSRFVYSVIENRGGKAIDFFWNGHELKVGDLCVVENSDGLEFGHVTISRRPAHPCQAKKRNLGKIHRKATEEDRELSVELLRKEKQAASICRKKIEEYGIEMSVTRAHYTFDGTKAIFFFTAEGRVDFRELVRDLASHAGVKVEMRQIGVRDEARLLGGCGPCGGELCCSSFLNDFAPVSIRMAKDQSLSLNPQKISGVCGRLMCCLSFEHGHYRELSKKAPKMGKMATAPDGKLGKVCQLNLLKEKALLAFEDHSKVEFPLNELRPRSEEGKPLEAESEGKSTTYGEPAEISQEKNEIEVSEPMMPQEREDRTSPAPTKKKGRRRKNKRGGKKRGASSEAGRASGPADATRRSAGSDRPNKETSGSGRANRGGAPGSTGGRKRQGQGKPRSGMQRKKQPPKSE